MNETAELPPFLIKLIPQWLALRQYLLRSLMAIGLIFLGLLPFANQLYTLLALPLLRGLTQPGHLIATSIIAPFWVPLQWTWWVTWLLSLPWVLYQAWRYLAPALYVPERRALRRLLIMTVALFYLGVSFAYGLVLPLIVHFLSRTVPEGVSLLPDMSHYLEFACHLLLAFGLAFEVPVMMLIIVKLKWLKLEQLQQLRRYLIILAFIIGMLIAPDVVTQIALALPLWLLFEIGLGCCRYLS